MKKGLIVAGLAAVILATATVVLWDSDPAAGQLLAERRAHDAAMVASFDLFVRSAQAELDLTRDALTPERVAALEAAQAKRREAFAPFDPNVVTTVLGREDGEGGVIVRLAREYTQRDVSTMSLTRERTEEKHLMVREDGRWLVRRSWEGCASCDRTGVCSLCKDGAAPCPNCQGTKRCDRCGGTGFVDSTPTGHMGAWTLLDSPAPTPADRTTPQAAAEAYAELMLRVEAAQGALWMERSEALAAHYRAHYHGDVVAKVEAGLAEARTKARARGTAARPAVRRVDVEGGDRAHAYLESAGIVEGTVEVKRLVLRRVGEAWLVDVVEDQCWSCRGAGKDGGTECGACKGEGYKEMPELF